MAGSSTEEAPPGEPLATAIITVRIFLDHATVVCTTERGEIMLSSVQVSSILGRWASATEAIIAALGGLARTMTLGAKKAGILIRHANYLDVEKGGEA
jgi:hypothetical protein